MVAPAEVFTMNEVDIFDLYLLTERGLLKNSWVHQIYTQKTVPSLCFSPQAVDLMTIMFLIPETELFFESTCYLISYDQL